MKKNEIKKWTNAKAMPIRVNEQTLREFLKDMIKIAEAAIERDLNSKQSIMLNRAKIHPELRYC